MLDQWKTNEIVYDVVFFVNQGSRGWILDRICKELSQKTGLHSKIIYTASNSRVIDKIPPARSYFFSHFELAMNLISDKSIRKGQKFVYFTHPDPTRNTDMSRLLTTLRQCTKTYAMNSKDVSWLTTLGLPEDQVDVMIGGVDCEIFDPKQYTKTSKSRNIIGIVSAYYDRKNPDLILEVVQNNPDMDFHLIAPGKEHTNNPGLVWSNFPDYDVLCSAPNFCLIETEYQNYSTEFSKFDAYLSLSKMEGGPIPMLECLSLGIPVVATETGFAIDVIIPGVNGELLPLNVQSLEVGQAIRNVCQFDVKDCRNSVLNYTWSSMADLFYSHFLETLTVKSELESYSSKNIGGFLGTGWHPEEEHGVWSRSSNAELDFRIEPDIRYTKLKLEVNTTHSDTVPKCIDVSFAGINDVQSFSLPINEVHELIVQIPENSDNKQILACNIEVDRMTTAADINPLDPRQLGVFLRSIQLVA